MPSSIYEQFWDAVYVEKALIEGGYNKGRAEGREEERQKNVQEKLKSARTLKANGVQLEVIVKSLHLTDDEAASL